MTRRKTDVELVADVLVDLTHEKIIDGAQATAAARRMMLTQRDMDEAVHRRRSVGWRAVILQREVTDARSERPRTEPVKKPMFVAAAPFPRKTREVDGETELWCVGVNGAEAHWAPEDLFLVRADRPWTRVSMCHDHRKRYQRSRQVKIAAREALSEVGLEFEVDEQSNLVGVICKECGVPFRPGDTAVGDAALAHKGCR